MDMNGPFISGTPEEINAALKAQMDQQAMIASDMRHRLDHFFDDVSEKCGPETLGFLRYLFNSCVNNPMAAAYFEGLTAAQLRLVHKVCIGCGEAHDEPHHVTDALRPDVSTEELPPEVAENLMREYNVRPDPDNPGRVICNGCGIEYVSLDDRMVKNPGDCHGCQHKAKFG